ncbi:MAG: SLC13 family permease [Candidatus Methanomethylophilaceae archaeon]
MIYIALIIFVLTYILIALHKLPGIEFKRSTAAIFGATLMILFGIISLTESFDSINFDVLFLLLGMMALVAGLEYCGLFKIIADYLVGHSESKIKLLAMIMVITALLSAIALNDAIVLMFTPIVIRCCSKIKTNPIPYLVGMMMSANIGSMATAVGNPQNAYIATAAGIDFLQFSMYLVPVAIVCLPVVFLLIWCFYRKNLNEPFGNEITVRNEVDQNIDPLRLKLMLVTTILMLIGFAISGYLDVQTYEIALLAGVVSLIIVMSKSTKDIKWVAGRIDWTILIFFIGLFILIAGVVKSGLIVELAGIFPGFGEGETPTMLSLSVFTAILSNLFSNVPAVMLISEMMSVGDLSLWLVLAASSTLAGNATLIGSAANIIVAERSEEYGIKLNFFKFMIIGMIVTIVTITIMILMMKLMFL